MDGTVDEEGTMDAHIVQLADCDSGPYHADTAAAIDEQYMQQILSKIEVRRFTRIILFCF